MSGLGQALKLRNVTLRSRLILSPMDRNYCDDEGRMTDRYIAYLIERAAGGAALVYPEAAFVRADGRCQRNQMALDSDDIVPALRRTADAVHDEGALLGVQLNHGGNTSKPQISGFQPVAPSPVGSAFTGGPVPRELERDDIEDVVEAYAAAAERSAAAGVDVVMVHAAHGYLIHQFMMPTINRRTDEYGNPAKFLSDVLLAVRGRVDLPIVLRVSAFDGVPDGLDEETTLEVLRRVPMAAVDAIDVSAGSYDAPDLMIPTGEREPGWLRSVAARYREFGKPVGVVGRINEVELAEDILRAGDADLVSVGRALHAAPDWARALLAGDGEEVAGAAPRPCIACNLCIDELGAGSSRCSVNPRAGREHLLPATKVAMFPASLPETLVVGAGPAGLETAVQLARLGGAVRVQERELQIGGQFAWASGLKGYPEYHRILDWYRVELDRLGVRVELGVEGAATAHASTAVMAVGSVGAPIETPGWGLPHVMDVRDWLRTTQHPMPDEVAIWGGDREALAVGDDLAARGVVVTFIFGGKALGRDVGRLAKPYLMHRLASNPAVRLHSEAAVTSIEADHVVVRSADGVERRVPTPGPLLVSVGAVPAAAHVAAGQTWRVGDAANNGGSLADVLADAIRLADRMMEQA